MTSATLTPSPIGTQAKEEDPYGSLTPPLRVDPLAPLHAIDGQAVFPERRGVSGDSKIESSFTVGNFRVTCFRGDPKAIINNKIVPDDHSLYLVVQARDAQTRFRLGGHDGNARVEIRIASLRHGFEESRTFDEETLQLLKAARGAASNNSHALNREEVNITSKGVEDFLGALKQLGDGQSGYATKLFGEHNDKLNEKALGNMLKSAELDAVLTKYKGCKKPSTSLGRSL